MLVKQRQRKVDAVKRCMGSKHSFALMCAVLSTGCASTMKDTALDKAAFDLNCPRSEIEVVELGYRSYGAKGCGQRISYEMEGECSFRYTCRAETDRKQ